MASKESLTCGKCSQEYTRPVMLECVHSFCRQCVDSMIKAVPTGDKIQCPTCKCPSKIPKNGVDGFASNIHLTNKVQLASYQTKKDCPCQRCNRKDVAVEFCLKCFQLLCQICVDDHEVTAMYSSHQRIDLDTFKSGDFKAERPQGMCQLHTDKQVDMYCLTHKELICGSCRVDSHGKCDRSDSIKSLSRAANLERGNLKTVLPQINEAIEKLEEAAEESKKMQQKIKTREAETTEKIDQVFDEFQKLLEERRNSFKKMCIVIAQDKNKVLFDQVQEFETSTGTFAFLRDQIDTDMSPEEILSVKEVIKKRAEEVIEDFKHTSLQMKEDEEMGLSFHEVDEIKSKIPTLGYYDEVPDPSKCSVNGLIVKKAVVGHDREFKVIIRNEKNEVIKRKVMFQYTLEQSGVDEKAEKPVVSVTHSAGSGVLTINPKVEGAELSLTVMVQNKPLNGFPFSMKVLQHRNYSTLPDVTKLTIQSSNCCPRRSIAVDSGFIYTTTQNAVLALKPDGTVIRTHNEKLSCPWGVTVLNRKAFVVDETGHKVNVYATAGEFICTFGGQGSGNGQFNNPRGICSDGLKHIFVADYGNRRIQVFAEDDKFVHSIACKSNPTDVAIDTAGKIHTTLTSTNNVEVFSWDGSRYTSDTTYNAGGKMESPCGIYIDTAGYKLITHENVNVLRVLKPNVNSDEVSFKLNCTGGVAVDADGKIFANIPKNSQAICWF